MQILTLSALAILMSVVGADAASFYATATYPDVAPRACFDNETSATSAYAECSSGPLVSAIGRSDATGLRAGTFLSGSMNDLGALRATSTRATAGVMDEITFSVEQGFFRIGVFVDGVLARNTGPGASLIETTGRVVGNYTTPAPSGSGLVGGNFTVFEEVTTYYSPGIGTINNSSIGQYGYNLLEIPFFEYVLNLNIVLDSLTRCFNIGYCEGSSNFLNTIVFGESSIVTAEGAAIPDAGFVSAAGINYFANIPGFEGGGGGGGDIPGVPLPAGGVLLLSGLALLARSVRRADTVRSASLV